LAIIPASLIIESAPTDYLLAASLTLHAHWGLSAILTDYIHGRTLPKFAFAVLYATSALVLAGLCYFNYNDIGLTKAVKKIWAL
jgi:succinate dehydrogenase (ubiquinone) membrane anchor subunit